MSLNLVGLTADLVSLFTSPPNTNLAVYTAWADAIRSYTNVIVPTVAAPAQDAARDVLLTNLTGMESGAVAVITAALTTYTTALAAAMAPPGAVPPPSVVALAAALTSAWTTPTTDPVAPATNAATAIDTYFRTGLTAPPVSAPWS